MLIVGGQSCFKLGRPCSGCTVFCFSFKLGGLAQNLLVIYLLFNLFVCLFVFR